MSSAIGRGWTADEPDGESDRVRESGADLVGEQNRHPELLDRRARDPGRGREHKLTVNSTALSDDEADLLIDWQAVALNTDAMSPAGHVAIVVEAGVLRAWTGAGDELAIVDVQDLDDLVGNVVDEIVGRRLRNRIIFEVPSTPSR